MSQSLLHPNIWLFCRVVPCSKCHKHTDMRLSPSCYFYHQIISSQLLAATRLVKVESTSPVRGDLTGYRVMLRPSRSRRQLALSTGIPHGLYGRWLSQWVTN